MKLAIFTKSNNNEGKTKSLELKSYLDKNYVDSFVFETADCKSYSEIDLKDIVEKVSGSDAVIVFGGDGTVLRAVAFASRANVPILSVNLGDMGFLAELERSSTPEQIFGAVNSYKCEKRILLYVNGAFGNIIALNDVVLKSGGATPVYIGATVNGEELDTYRSDGVIVSTPTGSTAYSLSAGGPVIAPDVDGLLVLPICPHTLHSRPVVVSSVSTVTLELTKEGETASLIVDGRILSNVQSGSKLNITKSKYNATFLRKETKGFYKRLLQKMNLWGVTKG